MACFDVYANPGRHVATTPYLLDVQSDLLDGVGSRRVSCETHLPVQTPEIQTPLGVVH
jgi:toxin CcdB